MLSSRDTAKNLPAPTDSQARRRFRNISPLSPPIYPAILRTSRNIHAEASATLYGNNRLTFYGSWNFLQFFTDIGRLNASLVRDVQLITSMSAFKMAERDEAPALVSGLRTLHISSHTISCVGPAVSCVMRFYQDMQPLLERHPSLQRVLSQWPQGHMHRERLCSFETPWQAIVLTFAAEDATASSEEKPFELGAAVAEMEAQLKEFDKEYGGKS
jgi:hypothetical protein